MEHKIAVKKPSLRVQALAVTMAGVLVGFGFTLGQNMAISMLVSWFGALG